MTLTLSSFPMSLLRLGLSLKLIALYSQNEIKKNDAVDAQLIIANFQDLLEAIQKI